MFTEDNLEIEIKNISSSPIFGSFESDISLPKEKFFPLFLHPNISQTQEKLSFLVIFFFDRKQSSIEKNMRYHCTGKILPQSQ